MNILIKYFGLLTEVTGCSEEILEFHGETVDELLNELYKKHTLLESNDFKIAQNQELVNLNEQINGTEIALLPPFSGG